MVECLLKNSNTYKGSMTYQELTQYIFSIILRTPAVNGLYFFKGK